MLKRYLGALGPLHNPNRLTCVSLLLCGALLLAGLWPFNFREQNRTIQLPDGKGLRFSAPVRPSMKNRGGMVFTPTPLTCRPKDSCEAGELTIEIELSADSEESSCLKRIVELRQADGREAFFISQWKSWLIVRSFKQPTAGGNPHDEIGIDGFFIAGRTGVLTVVSGPSETAIYVDNRPGGKTLAAALLSQDQTLDGHYLYLGNSPELSCPWAGSILSLAIYGKALTADDLLERQMLRTDGRWPCGNSSREAVACYHFEGLISEFIPDLSNSANDLWKPDHLVFKKRSISLPTGKASFFIDGALNLFGFIPIGFLLCLRLRCSGRRSAKNRLIFSAAAGFALSLAIEWIQVWLPGRDSSALDVIWNTAGTALGAFSGIYFDKSDKIG